MLESRGKEDLIAHLRSKGWNEYDAERIYQTVSSYFKDALTNGDHITMRGVFKLEARKRSPRVFKDNLNNKTIHFGERIEYVAKDYINQN